MDVVLVFPSNAGTIIATKTLKECGVTARMIPTPRSVQSVSNLCLSIDPSVESLAVSALKAANVSVSAVYR
jgi:hypothetical protein